MREERELLAGRIELPRFATDFRDRSTLVVVRGVDHQRDLQARCDRSSATCSR